ncbi:MAG: glucose-1-phosphate adenylyltransferase subunit GlgD [Negativicutes bacterium]|nr:glucose-1-phosphate adenylyltransferase subunit GlgD [Negativicutes bacterium]
MIDVIGIINLVSNDYALGEITQHRPLATVPFGGRYRLIDFALSGMINSGIDNVGVLVPLKQRSLLDHLRSGRDWQLDRKRDGLTLLPPAYERQKQPSLHEIGNLHANLAFFQKSRQQWVMMIPGGIVGSFDFKPAIAHHRASGADITLLYSEQEPHEYDCTNHVGLDIAADGRVQAIYSRPTSAEARNCFWGAMICHKDLFTSLITKHYAGSAENLLQALGQELGNLCIKTYRYPGMLGRIHCLKSYYRQNMLLLNPETWRQLFLQSGPIRTKVQPEHPAKYAADAHVAASIVAGGCIIRGAVDRSILFSRVFIEQGARVTGSILMANTCVAKNAVLENVICDKDVKISAGRVLCGQPDNPLVIKKGTVM